MIAATRHSHARRGDRRHAEDRKDPKLLEKLLGERAGILRWAVDGCLAWQRMNGLHAPKEVLDATTTYREEQDIVGQYIEDKCDTAKHFSVPAALIHQSYRAWCEANGHRWMSARALGGQLIARGFFRGKDAGVRTWFGLRLHSSIEHSDVRPPSRDEGGEPYGPFDDL